MTKLNLERTALVLVDMQNDFLHPEGAYGRNGQACDAIARLPERLAPLAKAMRAAGGWIVSTHFTLVPSKKGRRLSRHICAAYDRFWGRVISPRAASDTN